MNDICCIGHITLDKIVTPKQTTYMPGGTSYYFSHGISHLKDTKHYKLVTALAPTEFKAVEDIRTKGIEVKVIPSRRTVYFENTYGENQDNRTQRVLAKADPFTVEQLENVEANIFHLGSLLSDDFPLDVIGQGLVFVHHQLHGVPPFKVLENDADKRLHLPGRVDAAQFPPHISQSLSHI